MVAAVSPPEDVEADVALQVDVGVIDHGLALHLGGVVGVALAHLRGGGDRGSASARGATGARATTCPPPATGAPRHSLVATGHVSVATPTPQVPPPAHRDGPVATGHVLVATSPYPNPRGGHLGHWSHRGGHQPPVLVPTHTVAAHGLVATGRTLVATTPTPGPGGHRSGLGGPGGD